MTNPTVHIVQLYPADMNIYGDWGNTLALTRRLEWRDITPVVHSYNPGDSFPETVDIIVGGGGQDSGQQKIEDDLRQIAPKLHELANHNVPMLVICGLYQLFGHSFTTREGAVIDGIGLLDVTTVGGDERLIGNITTQSTEFGQIVGYENHSGITTLGAQATPLGMVIKGAGNNNQDQTEGARYLNVIGSYLHGSLLPKNPHIADFLIRTALKNNGVDLADFKDLDDTIEQRAHEVASLRPR